MSEHIDRATLVAYVDGDQDIDRASIIRHVFSCVRCRKRMDGIQQMLFLMRNEDVLTFVAENAAGGNDDDLREHLVAMEHMERREAEEADNVFRDLLGRPIEAWDLLAAADASYRSTGLVRRVIAAAEAELDRKPQRALQLIQFAERWSRGENSTSRLLLGDLWKQRANALRQLMRYTEALSAAEIAETFYASVPDTEFDIGQARITSAVTLTKMNRYADALRALDRADELLTPFGETVPAAKSALLRAGIFFQQGNIDAAERGWRDVQSVLERLDDKIELARVKANLAECHRVRGAFDDAMRGAQDAIRAYDALGMQAERIRPEWTIANVHIGRGDNDLGLEGLIAAAGAFATRGMIGDEAFVKLDIVEELLRREEWARARALARELVDLFTRAGVTVASVDALSALREAVEREHATVSLVRYVRDFVAIDDPSRPFVPPS
ncbi:MAG: DNA-binding transcriptional activator of the family [Acidobacteria bacterium]|nr:DNA-binding transcriptional activator of the family [Acidobacteriota bacterium]